MDAQAPTQEIGPSEAIRASGRTLHQLAEAAGVSIGTVLAAKQTNCWPSQRRTREGLRRALGLDQAVTP